MVIFHTRVDVHAGRVGLRCRVQLNVAWWLIFSLPKILLISFRKNKTNWQIFLLTCQKYFVIITPWFLPFVLLIFRKSICFQFCSRFSLKTLTLQKHFDTQKIILPLNFPKSWEFDWAVSNWSSLSAKWRLELSNLEVN